MPIDTNLNVSPYFDDYSSYSSYYRVLFRPGVAVQARELNQLQSMLQEQVERFGSHIFKNGSVVSGINFSFFNSYNYVKIFDNTTEDIPVELRAYKNLLAKNSNNLIAKITNYKTGLQTRDPEMNYLFLSYTNAGDTGTDTVFSNNEILTIYSPDSQLFSIKVIDGGVNYSNSDTVVITPALIVNSTAITNGQIDQTVGIQTASLNVIEANTTFGSITIQGTTFSNSEYTLLKVRPLSSDMSASNTTFKDWSFYPGYNLTQGSNTAYVHAIAGAGANAFISTDGSGVIKSISMSTRGTNYVVQPVVTINSTTGNETTLNLEARNYAAKVRVANSSFNANNTTPVGSGFAASVTEGIIYQKGHFVRVFPQVLVVNNYTSNVDNVSLGFKVNEFIVNSSTDATLLDVATGTPNFSAPGANRLRLSAELIAIPTDQSDTTPGFFSLVEFKDGRQHKLNTGAAYNVLGKELAKRTVETSGNFVIDPFIVTTTDNTTWSNTHINAFIDSGLAYIEGERVEYVGNTKLPIRRSSDYNTITGQSMSLNYGNYVRIKDVTGVFDFKTGANVELYDTARQALTNGDFNFTPNSVYTHVGTAKARSLAYESGIPGTNTAVYRLYLFDINLNPGKSFFQDAKMIYQSGASKAVGDIVLDSSTAGTGAVLQDNLKGGLTFYIGKEPIRSLSNSAYFYRSTVNNAVIGTNGTTTITISDYFTYGNSATLSSVQRNELILVPLANVISTNTISANVANSSNVITLLGGALSSRFDVGDYVRVVGATESQSAITQVTSLVNSTALTIRSNWAYSTNNTSATITRAFPQNVPIVLSSDRVSACTDSTSQQLTINLSNTSGEFAFTSSVNAMIAFTAKKVNTAEITKTIKRGLFVKLDLGTHPANTTGPWSLGIPDVFRLNKVYIANSSAVNTNSTDITKFFYVDNGQRDDYYDLSNLKRINLNSVNLTTSDYLLVEVDAFDLPSPSSAGYFTIESYNVSYNTAPRSTLANNFINFNELQDFKGSDGSIRSARGLVDFRPRVSNTANLTSNVSLATTNPSSNDAFNSSDKLFPVPDSTITFDYDYYLSRIDVISLSSNGDFIVTEGVPADLAIEKSELPGSSLKLATITIPPFPSLPSFPNANIASYYAFKAVSSTPDNTLLDYYTADTVQSSYQQPKRYTMEEIGDLEKRIKGLEDFATLTALENEVSKKKIPSSSNSSLQRFKNGFLIDDFDDSSMSNLADKSFTASVRTLESRLGPQSFNFNFNGRFNTANTATKNSVRREIDDIEDEILKRTDFVLMLPPNGEVAIIKQLKASIPGSTLVIPPVVPVVTTPGAPPPVSPPSIIIPPPEPSVLPPPQPTPGVAPVPVPVEVPPRTGTLTDGDEVQFSTKFVQGKKQSYTIDVGTTTGGVAKIYYHFGNAPDKIDVTYNGKTYSTGFVKTGTNRDKALQKYYIEVPIEPGQRYAELSLSEKPKGGTGGTFKVELPDPVATTPVKIDPKIKIGGKKEGVAVSTQLYDDAGNITSSTTATGKTTVPKKPGKGNTTVTPKDPDVDLKGLKPNTTYTVVNEDGETTTFKTNKKGVANNVKIPTADVVTYDNAATTVAGAPVARNTIKTTTQFKIVDPTGTTVAESSVKVKEIAVQKPINPPPPPPPKPKPAPPAAKPPGPPPRAASPAPSSPPPAPRPAPAPARRR